VLVLELGDERDVAVREILGVVARLPDELLVGMLLDRRDLPVVAVVRPDDLQLVHPDGARLRRRGAEQRGDDDRRRR
jgi:hypothetical protein